jgi:hypothetical protein
MRNLAVVDGPPMPGTIAFALAPGVNRAIGFGDEGVAGIVRRRTCAGTPRASSASEPRNCFEARAGTPPRDGRVAEVVCQQQRTAVPATLRP